MDVNELRSIITVVSFLLFIGIVCWAWSSRSKTDFDEAARLPLEDDQPLPPGERGPTGQQGNDKRTSQ
jgi:cytochrome c oxidase cbb3-type subunit IV